MRLISLLLLNFIFGISLTVSSQTPFWEETFGTDVLCGIESADGYTSGNGVWTVEPIGANGALAHEWYVSPREATRDLGICGDGCLNDPDLIKNSLYVSIEAQNDLLGAAFENNAATETSLRVETPVISFAGVTEDMVLILSYIRGDHPSSSCTLQYYDGATWSDLLVMDQTTGSCGGAGLWTEVEVNVPGFLLGNPNVQFGFLWENDGPDVMASPELSFALGKFECVCSGYEEIEGDISEPLTNPGFPDSSFEEDECSTTITEVYYLEPWVILLDEEGNVDPSTSVILTCTAGTNEMCTPEPVEIEYVIPGCEGVVFSYTVNPFGFAQGPELEFIPPWVGLTVDPDPISLCDDGCADFSFATGLLSPDWMMEADYEVSSPGGTVEVNWIEGVGFVAGEVCYDTPGTYTVFASASICGFSSSAQVDVVVTSGNLTPQINISETEICPGECVEVSMEEIPDATATWSFSGATVTGSNQTQPGDVCFDQVGDQDVSLFVETNDDCGTATLSGGVTVLDCEPATADFLASISTICAGECIDFTDGSTGTEIESWEWTFEGASQGSSSDQNPAGICFDAPGFYDVTLSVTSVMGTDELTIPSMIEVLDCSPPTASVSSSATEICVGECVDFSDESTGLGIDSWSWSFEGASLTNSDLQNPTGVCYDTPGSYEVTLSVSNQYGSDEIIETGMIVVDPCYPDPVPDFDMDLETICPGECVNFTNMSATNGVTVWSWSFEGADSPVSDLESPGSICYSNPGTYDVTLEVTDEGGTESITFNDLITVDPCPDPVADFSANTTFVCDGECIDFTNLSTGDITFYEWSFPGADDTSSTAVNPSVCYSEPGLYSVSLIAGDDEDTSTTTLTDYIIVDPCLPVLEVEASEDRICVGDCVSFNNMSADPSSDWVWNFQGGEPSMSNAENPIGVCYYTPGTYDVGLQVLADGELVDTTFSGMITVIDSCGPVANFNFTPIVCLGQCYDFENTSEGGTDHFWTFEGAATPVSEAENPTDICYLNETGVFNVTLTTTDDFGSSSSITQQITVVPPSSLNAGSDQTIIQGTAANLSAFVGSSTGEIVWQPYNDVSCFSCASTSTVPLDETTTFVVYFEESGGCQTTDTVTVFVDESLAFGIPGSFSPNDDGVNDILYFRGSNISRFNLMIYNRYGQKVFETNDQSVGWDGTHAGRELNSGVFGYHLEVFQTDGSRSVRKGDVTMVR